ncbi:MAG TPA: ATP-binding protein [Burkholderiales bacterium]|nr:ATP-binding protein [Burkholderiales bacterium]
MQRATSPAIGLVETLLEEDVEEAYEHAPAGYVSALPDGTLVKVNATFLAWTGFSGEQLVRRGRLQELLSVPGRIYYETHLAPLLAMQGTLNEIALDIRCADGRLLPVMLNAAQKRMPDGKPVLTRYTVFNATERRRYERQLLQARRQAEAAVQAKAELLAMLSHDIRTPLGSIMAVAQLLQRSALAPEQEAAVRILRSSSSAMLTLVDQILERSRAEADTVGQRQRAFDLRALVHEVTANLAPLAQHKGITLRCSIDPRMPAAVIGDATMLSQVLGNLLGNALKFTEAGYIEIELAVLELRAGEVKVRMRVSDTGIGIAEHDIPRIFEQYGQAHAGITARYGGSGLGLAISRKLLQSHGSELQVRSTLGRGSEFWFDLALALNA